jgi:hypothetical protein
MKLNLPTIGIVAGISLALLAACGGGTGPDDPTATSTPLQPDTPTATAPVDTPTSGPSATPTATPTETPEPPDEDLPFTLAHSAAYLVYYAQDGESVARVAHMFGGEPGADGTLTAFWNELLALNQLEHEFLAPGQAVAVPVESVSTNAQALSAAGLWSWLAENGQPGLDLRVPSTRLIDDGYQGALVAQTVDLYRDGDSDVVTGYAIEFAETDRPAFKGGEADPAAVIVGRAFTLYCGPQIARIDPLPSDTVHAFGNECMVTAPPGDIEARSIADFLELVPMQSQ